MLKTFAAPFPRLTLRLTSPAFTALTLVATLLMFPAAVQGALVKMAPTPDGYTRKEFLATNLVHIPFQPKAETLKWLKIRGDAQAKEAVKFSAFHDFQFTDRLAESGITFRHRVVDDAGKTVVAGHYDHGMGLAAADVDGDGLVDNFFVNQRGGNQLWRNLGGGGGQVRGHHGQGGRRPGGPGECWSVVRGRGQ